MDKIAGKAYVVAVDMGYGHQRAAFPLLQIATTPTDWNIQTPVIISANDYPNIPERDKSRWDKTRKIYEGISRIQGFPILGKRVFHLMSYVQKIENFYPRRDLSKPTLPLKWVYKMIKNSMGRHLIETLNQNPLPLICSFPIPAFFAEEHGYKGEIYCLCTDTDVARSWAPLHPQTSRINYFTPTLRTKERLIMYGVRPEKIIVSGFPLPTEVSADEVLISSLRKRISNLDPRGVYQNNYKKLLTEHLGSKASRKKSEKNEKARPLTIAFAIGGAGAQSNVGIKILESLCPNIKKGEVKLNLVAGTSVKILNKFEQAIEQLGLNEYRDAGVRIIYRPNKYEYFQEFNDTLADTDILWTKPSELSFYAGLGLPIIMSPTLGVQEEYNRRWLHMIGAGFEQYDPRFSNEWLFDWLNSGILATAAMSGFLNAPKRAVEHIESIMLNEKQTEIEEK